MAAGSRQREGAPGQAAEGSRKTGQGTVAQRGPDSADSVSPLASRIGNRVWIDAVLTEPVPDAAGSGTGAAAPVPQPAATDAASDAGSPPPLLPLAKPGSGASGSPLPGVGVDVLSPKYKLPGGLGPKVFGPLPETSDTDEKKNSVLPGIGAGF